MLCRIIDVAVKYKMGCAVHYSFTRAAELQAEWSKRGMNIILHSADIKVPSHRLSARAVEGSMFVLRQMGFCDRFWADS